MLKHACNSTLSPHHLPSLLTDTVNFNSIHLCIDYFTSSILSLKTGSPSEHFQSSSKSLQYSHIEGRVTFHKKSSPFRFYLSHFSSLAIYQHQIFHFSALRLQLNSFDLGNCLKVFDWSREVLTKP
jgi:hypothetical protein